MTVAAYRPTTVDSLHITVESGVAVILNQTNLPREKLGAIFSLGFVYSPVVVLIDIRDRDNISYAVSQMGDRVDLKWVCNALSRFEEGWELIEGILFSPVSSELPKEAVMEMFCSAEDSSLCR